jgi:hypothetical protein
VGRRIARGKGFRDLFVEFDVVFLVRGRELLFGARFVGGRSSH